MKESARYVKIVELRPFQSTAVELQEVPSASLPRTV